ncbi:phage tail protein [Klebsiella michiganensis]
MARQTFTWFPDFESEKTIKPEVTVLKFGDDYEQRQSQGLNRIKEEWSLTFRQPYAIGNAIDDFLMARGAVESFFWTTPRNKKIICACDSHTVKRYPGYLEITCTLRQVFEA